ncbi:Calcineurin-like phosphoesterase [Streptomyces mirabilis]|uniref:Calcineurin-like phosphoesterase n=1 Tax=Streptomyces mirabilis TaxID=68239 RepID=A0A1I2NUQ9_9ACTN|nr:Calcineurin-like phosphoesterase [Streptomyces mirabilis]
MRDRLWELPGRVDALLVTGDIADHGTEAEYEEAARLFGPRDGEPPFPVLTCPGNHDIRAACRKALLGQPVSEGPVNSVHVFDDAAVLMCDSSIPGQDEGELGEETYAWIETTLDELDGAVPALLAFHHPPVAPHHPPPHNLKGVGGTPTRTPTSCAGRLPWPRCWSAGPRSSG